MDPFRPAFSPYPKLNEKEDLFLPLREDHVLVRATAGGLSLCRGWPKALDTVPEEVHFVGWIHDRACFTAEMPRKKPGVLSKQGPPGHTFRDLRSLHGLLNHGEYAAATTAVQLLHFQRSHRFCPGCGGPLGPVPEHWLKRCAPCGLDIEPRAQPSVVGLLIDGLQVLLVQPVGLKDMFTLPAAVVGPGQTLEQALRLSLSRSLDLSPGNLAYYESQPWPFPDRLMIGLYGKGAAGPLQVERRLLSAARWCHVDDLPPLPAPLSLARRMIDWYAQLPRIHGKPSLPRR